MILVKRDKYLKVNKQVIKKTDIKNPNEAQNKGWQLWGMAFSFLRETEWLASIKLTP